MKYCNECGTKINMVKPKFCPNCGENFGEESVSGKSVASKEGRDLDNLSVEDVKDLELEISTSAIKAGPITTIGSVFEAGASGGPENMGTRRREKSLGDNKEVLNSFVKGCSSSKNNYKEIS